MARDPNPRKSSAQLSVRPGEVLLRRRAVEARTGLGCTTIYGWMKSGRFPKSISLGKTVVWPASVIDAWIAEQIADGTSGLVGEDVAAK